MKLVLNIKWFLLFCFSMFLWNLFRKYLEKVAWFHYKTCTVICYSFWHSRKRYSKSDANFNIWQLVEMTWSTPKRVNLTIVQQKNKQISRTLRNDSNYSRVWNKCTPLNKRSPLENLAKRLIVAPFLPYTMKSGIRP